MPSRSLQILLRWIGALPLPIVHGFGAGIGWTFYLVPNRRRRTARINIALCLPELPQRERRRLLRRTLIEAGKTVTETAVLWNCSARRLHRLVRSVVGGAELEHSFEERKGILIAAPHLGAWEMVGLYCSSRFPMSSLYASPRDPGVDEPVRRARSRLGARLIPAGPSAVRALYEALERGEMAGLLPDQMPARRCSGVFAPFFGVQAHTMVLLSRFAIKTGAPVLFTYARRLPFGRGYELHFLRAPQEIHENDVERSVCVVNAMVERCARAVPEQYQWIYKRFRARPEGESMVY